MKTAEEWANEDQIHDAVNKCYNDDASEGLSDLTKCIKQIQLDAWKQGMMDSYHLCISDTDDMKYVRDKMIDAINKRKEI